MSGNQLGKKFSITSFGESHGSSIGVVIDGVPAGMTLDLPKIQHALNRRRPGQSHIVSPRQEEDVLEILSGINKKMQTLGSSLCAIVRNKNSNTSEYEEIQKVYRPSHADFTYDAKYGILADSGGGRASARETIARVIAGSIAEQIFDFYNHPIEIASFVSQVGEYQLPEEKRKKFYNQSEIDSFITRCPDVELNQKIENYILDLKDSGDSIGGVITFKIRGVPPGLGEPVFDKLEAEIAKAMLSIPACRGIEFGLGFASAIKKASEQNDAITGKDLEGRVLSPTNFSGGIQGGISNGQEIYGNLIFKAPSTIRIKQHTLDKNLNPIEFKGPKNGRHDPCVLPRAVPIVDAMAAIVLCDHFLRWSNPIRAKSPSQNRK